MNQFFDNLSEAPRKSKARDIVFYLDQIRNVFELEIDKLEVVCTDGDIRPPHPYQWIAKTKIRVGEDDPFEGIGWTPFQAVYRLYKNVKAGWDYYEDEEDDFFKS